MIKNILKQKHSANNTENSPRQFKFLSDNNLNVLQNNRFQFAQKHSLSLYNQKAIYSFIPKNGCTTLRTSLASANGFFQHEKNSEHINWVHNNSYTFSAQLQELVTASYTFTVLRCPYSRLVSLFLDKFVDKTPIAWTFYRLSNNEYDLDDLSFHDFLTKLMQQSGLISAEIHWRPQSDFLIYQKYDDYFDFNDFGIIKNVLLEKVGLDLIDARDITKHGRERYQTVQGDFSKTKSSELKSMKQQGLLPDIDSLFNTELKEIAFKLYKSDFDLRDHVRFTKS